MSTPPAGGPADRHAPSQGGPVGSDNPLRVGRRVVVRHRRPPGSHPPLTDVVGTVVALDDTSVTVDTVRGEVVVARADFVVVKEVPPAPVRRGRPHQAIGATDLERVMSDGWRAVEEEWQEGWLLRASSGFTHRGNSVLPLGEPGGTLDAAIGSAERWYAARDLPSKWQLPLPPGGGAAEGALGAQLLDRGYTVRLPTLVMTGASSDVSSQAALTDSSVPVTVDASLTMPWLEAYARQRTIVPGVTEQLLTSSAGQFFASVADQDGRLVAVARMSVHPGWCGLQALWVDPDRRGRGTGRTLVQALATLARENAMPSMFLQVEQDNDAAIELYRSVGFTTHHTYVYLSR